MPLHQLRIYEIDSSKRAAFHERFRDHATRIMDRYGFCILAMWEAETEERLEFVYLLEWDDRDTLERSWAAFMADESWAAVKSTVRAAVGGEPVLGVADRILEVVAYPPYRLPAHDTA